MRLIESYFTVAGYQAAYDPDLPCKTVDSDPYELQALEEAVYDITTWQRILTLTKTAVVLHPKSLPEPKGLFAVYIPSIYLEYGIPPDSQELTYVDRHELAQTRLLLSLAIESFEDSLTEPLTRAFAFAVGERLQKTPFGHKNIVVSSLVKRCGFAYPEALQIQPTSTAFLL